MKKNLMFLILVTACAVTLPVFAQTPYDSFEPEQAKKAILSLPQSQFQVANPNENAPISLLELDMKSLTLNIKNNVGELVGSVILNPNALKWTTMDPKAEEFYSISPYAYCMNNPTRFVDFKGDSAWSVTREWNENDQKGFADFASQRLKSYEGKNIDCADLALSVIIDYASENGLPLEISTANGTTFDSNSDSYNSVDEFKNGYTNDNGVNISGVLPSVGSKDIPTNTFELNKSAVQPGDMIILSAPASHIVNYSQTEPVRRLTYGNIGEPVKTSSDWTNVTRDSRGVPYIYVPNNRTVHRWNVLKNR